MARLRTALRLALIAVAVLPCSAPTASADNAAQASAGRRAPKTRGLPRIELAYRKYSLKNGLEVILHEDHSLPFVAVNIWYHTGPANEPTGRSGFAHLFEHLMFEGSRYAGTEFDHLLESVGATNVNGTTDWDRTNYFATVPREHLSLVLWLESDRMGFMPDILTEERLDVQRRVVQNERRESYENAPYGPSLLALYNALFPAGHPYHGAVIGSMRDIGAATLDDVRQFFERFYAPSNATLTIAGDFDESSTTELVERYFGTLPARSKPEAVRPAITPALQGPKRLVVREPVELGQVMMSWITPPAFSADDAALEVAVTLLAQGKTSVLYRKLLLEEQIASEVSGWLDSNALASMAVLGAVAASGKTTAEIETKLSRLLADLSAKGPSEAEVARAKRKILLGLLSELQLLNGPSGESGRAGMLQRFNHYLGDPGAVSRWVNAIEAVTQNDVTRVVRTHLKESARLVVVTEPGAAKP
jgi:zinc protease